MYVFSLICPCSRDVLNIISTPSVKKAIARTGTKPNVSKSVFDFCEVRHPMLRYYQLRACS